MSEREAWDRGFDMGFRACLDQQELSGLQPKSESAVKEFIRAARRRLGLAEPVPGGSPGSNEP